MTVHEKNGSLFVGSAFVLNFTLFPKCLELHFPKRLDIHEARKNKLWSPTKLFGLQNLTVHWSQTVCYSKKIGGELAKNVTVKNFGTTKV